MKEIPTKNKIDVNNALKQFHDRYYVSGNMKFVIIACEPMSDLELLVSDSLKDVRSGPADNMSIDQSGFPWKPYDSTKPMKEQHGVALGCAFRIPPTHDMHELQLTWQLPSQNTNYKSKPTEFVAHALGHESAGSILAELKSRGWATALVAGVSLEDGFTCNTGVTLFNVTISLTSAGLSQWIFVAGIVFEFIGIMRRKGPEKWIHDELRDVAAIQYRFHEEPDPRWFAQRLCVNMLPQTKFQPENFINGANLIFEWKPEEIVKILDLLNPESVRIDLLSSRLNEKVTSTEDEFLKLTLCERPGRPPISETYTGTQYWLDPIPQPILESWGAVFSGNSTVGYAGLGGEELFPKSLSLPPKNPFISSDFQLKRLKQYDYSNHEFIGAEIRVKQAKDSKHLSYSAKRRSLFSWDLGVIIAFDTEMKSFLVRYPAKEGVKRWHRFDTEISIDQTSKNKVYTTDKGKFLIRFISALPLVSAKSESDLKSIQKREDYDDVAELFASVTPDGSSTRGAWASFPRHSNTLITMFIHQR